MPAVVLVALYVAVLMAPLALAWVAGLPRRPLLDELSSGMGLVAFAVLLVEFVLSGRFRPITGRVGMDVTMRQHQRAARWIVALIVLHPFLYTLPIPDHPPPWDVTAQGYLRLGGATLVSGGLAWILLIVLVVTAIARDSLPYKYETWRLAHGLGAALVAGLSAHHVLAAGRYSGEPTLAGFWLGLLGLALASLAYVYLVSPLLKLRRPFEVLSVRPLAERTWELAIARTDRRPFAFRAGQFVWLNVGHSPFSLHENPFSISSAPASGERVEFVIKEAGDFTRSVPAIRPGSRAWVDGPHGGLVAPGPEAPGIGLIAGGVGVAPLLSILRQLRAEGDTRPVALLYGNRLEAQIVYRDELDRLAAETPPGGSRARRAAGGLGRRRPPDRRGGDRAGLRPVPRRAPVALPAVRPAADDLRRPDRPQGARHPAPAGARGALQLRLNRLARRGADGVDRYQGCRGRAGLVVPGSVSPYAGPRPGGTPSRLARNRNHMER